MFLFSLLCSGVSLHSAKFRPLADPLPLLQWQPKEYWAMLECSLQGNTGLLEYKPVPVPLGSPHSTQTARRTNSGFAVRNVSAFWHGGLFSWNAVNRPLIHVRYGRLEILNATPESFKRLPLVPLPVCPPSTNLLRRCNLWKKVNLYPHCWFIYQKKSFTAFIYNTVLFLNILFRYNTLFTYTN